MIIVQDANYKELERWDEFVAASENGTLFHTRQFLQYHGLKFDGKERFLSVRKGSELVAVLPVSIETNEDVTVARSPYGGSFGGFAFSSQPSYSQSMEIIDALIKWLQGARVDCLSMTLPTRIYNKQASDTFAFALQESGFVCSNRDICSVMKIPADSDVFDRITGNARNMVRKAEKSGVEVVRNATIDQFWPLLEDTYKKHGKIPTHTKEELQWLLTHMDERVSIHVVCHEGEEIAGICEFRTSGKVNSAFYICQKSGFERLQGPSLLIFNSIEHSQKAGCQYYDFGTSTVNMTARPGVFRFKESFNAMGVFRETYEWKAA